MRPELAAFQQSFAAAILSGTPSGFDRWPGFAVYRNTSMVAAIDSLAASYSATRAILGDADFRELARAYFRDNPPATPVLAEYGAGFADWLEQRLPTDRQPNVADVARIDRMQTETHLAEEPDDACGIGAAAISEEAWMMVVAVLHPAARFRWFATPAPSVWLASRDFAAPKEFATAGTEEGILLTRPRGAVEALLIARAEHQLLMRLQRGESVGQAAIAAACACPRADIGASFKRLLESHAIHHFQRKEHQP